MRGYILLSLTLSVALPFVTVPGHWASLIMGHSVGSFPINVMNPYTVTTSSSTAQSSHLSLYSNSWALFIAVASIIYFLGVLFKSVLLIRNVNKILTNIKMNVKHQEGTYWFVNTNIKLPAFSFFNFIFINKDFKSLSNEDILRIKNHEIIHAKQWHTLDILFVELISVIFWFSPLVRYAKIKLQEIHEFIADEETAGQGEMKKVYTQLLFNLATNNKSLTFMTGFSGKQINKRIVMVSKRRSFRWSKLLFICLFPVAFVLLLSFSYLDNSTANAKANINIDNIGSSNSAKVGKIKWVNNTIISSTELDKVLGLKKGDVYEKKTGNTSLDDYTDRVTTFYLDKGYLFVHIETTETPDGNGLVDITFKVYEGAQGKIATVDVKGNKSVPTDEIMKLITLKPGDLFSKSKIIESVRSLSMSKKFDPEKIIPEIIPEKKNPNSEFVRVNIIFEVVEK